ncbi:MAG: DUF1934 domain-containing protein [Lachnospiraceae bacterium]|nr:DUF1934 domain-containing protein [Lachnospiraceae bacterium]
MIGIKHNIQISVRSIQNFGSEPEVILTKTTGSYCLKNGFHTINYYELDEYGSATDNFILLSEKEMQMRKSGSFSGQFLFVLDNRTETSYLTPFGKIIFEVETESYNLNVQKNCLNVQLRYKLYTSNQLFSENFITIEISENN